MFYVLCSVAVVSLSLSLLLCAFWNRSFVPLLSVFENDNKINQTKELSKHNLVKLILPVYFDYYYGMSRVGYTHI